MMRSLRARLIAAAVVFISIALLLIWFALTKIFSDYVGDNYTRELQAISDTIIADLEVKDGTLVLTREPTDTRFEIAAGGRYWQLNGEAGPIKRSRSLWDEQIAPMGKVASGSKLSLANGPAGEQLLVHTQEAIVENNGKDYKATIYAAADYEEFSGAVSNFRWQLMGMLALTGVLILMAAILQIYVGLKPLFNIRKAVNGLRQGHVAHIDNSGPQEVRPLIDEINTLMADNKAAVERARARAADLAHGLKTPLTLLAQIGEALSQAGNKPHAKMVEQQVFTIRSRVDRQLALARVGNPDRVIIDTATHLKRLIATIQPLVDAQNLNLHADLAENLSIAADPTDFLEAVGNVVDNALRHARENVWLATRKTAQTVQIEISDDGEGIEEPKRASALERGRRLDESGEGTGLGLSITAELLNAHHGSILLSQSAMGGLKVTLNWPLAAQRK